MKAGQCGVLLKEWAVTCRALAEGRQVLILRKGGILDDEGVFALEHRIFWLLPTFVHQDETLVQPAHRDLFGQVAWQRPQGAERLKASVDLLAAVEAVYALGEDDADRLPGAAHIWSRSYLDVRFGYKPENPLLAVVLRVYQRPEPHAVTLAAGDLGCRSWCELDLPLDSGTVVPVLSDTEFAEHCRVLDEALGGNLLAVANV